MKKVSCFINIASTLGNRQMRTLGTLSLALLATAQLALAASATWNLDPASNDWSIVGNWTPATVPSESTDVATFDVSNVTDISVATEFQLGGIIFNPGASSYTFTISAGYVGYIGFQGEGVINNSGVTQTFVTLGGVSFAGNATAGDGVVYAYNGVSGPSTVFIDSSNLGSATFINKGDSPGLAAAYLEFAFNSSAAEGTIINQTGDTYGGITRFEGSATAANSMITTYSGAMLSFENFATGGSATLIVDGGTISFEDRSNGEMVRVELTNGGRLGIGAHNSAAEMAVGSLEGDSTSALRLGGQQLSIGGNGRSTTFSGQITQGGSLVKTGSEQLTLTAANTYSGGTTISGGTLLAQAHTGSATGTGPVSVNAGTLGGRGAIAGAVTVGTGTGNGAFFAPGATRPDTLTLSRTLTFKADGTYQCDLSLGQVKADQVSAQGVAIESGAQFVFRPKGLQMLTRGTVFTVINNTAATPISGTFANLADGSKLATGAGNKLRVSYAGGDGNDLTLTVVQ